MTMYKKTGKPARNVTMRKIAAALAAAAFFMSGTVSFADLTGTVTEQSVKIRQEASATSEVIGGKTYGQTVTITDEVSDSTGTTWYQVVVDANTKGYIRADLVSKEGSESTPTDTASAGSGTSENAGDVAGPETPLDAQYATVSVPAAKIRTAPSTDGTVVESLVKDTQLVISGQSVGQSDGKTWYYVTFTTGNGSQKSGYVRSDLVTPGDMVPVEETQPEEMQPEEETQPEEIQPEETPDYEVKYTQSQDGSEEYAWYLIDNTPKKVGEKATQQKLEDVLSAAHANGTIIADNTRTITKQRIVIIVMGVVVVALIVTLVIMIFKLRDAYYEDYEDDEDEDEEDEEEEEEPARTKRSRSRDGVEEETPRRRRDTEEESPRKRRDMEEAPRKRRDMEEAPRRRREAEETPRRRRDAEEEAPRRRRDSGEEAPRRRRETESDSGRARSTQKTERRPVMQEMDGEEEAARASAKQSAKRKSKNFLLDDDEFEFEFLSMDDKDLK